MQFREFNVDIDLDLYVKGDIDAFEESFPGVSLPGEMVSEITNGIKAISFNESVQGITAYEEYEPIGFVIVSIRMFYIVPFGYIESIYLEPQFRGKGVVDQLLSKAEEWARTRGAKFMQLDVSVVNDAAKNAYDRLGYTNTRMQMEKYL